MEAPFAVADVEACDIARWYPRFKGSTFNTRIVPVDAAFCAYLEEDRVVLPRLPGPAREGDPRAASWGRSGSDDEGSVHSGDGDEDAADAVRRPGWDRPSPFSPHLSRRSLRSPRSRRRSTAPWTILVAYFPK